LRKSNFILIIAKSYSYPRMLIRRRRYRFTCISVRSVIEETIVVTDRQRRRRPSLSSREDVATE